MLLGTGCVSCGRQEAGSLLILAPGTSDEVGRRLRPLKGTLSQGSLALLCLHLALEDAGAASPNTISCE